MDEDNLKNRKYIMNENINLVKILKDCPKGTKLYTPLVGEVVFCEIKKNKNFPIRIEFGRGTVTFWFTKEGKYYNSPDGECLLFPSKNQRDWSKFKALWLKKTKFDPQTLKAFDRVLIRDFDSENWSCGFFSHIVVFDDVYRYTVGKVLYEKCIPYNEDTKHLVGTTEEAPEYYRYWED